MSDPDSIILTFTVGRGAETVWRCLTDQASIHGWWGPGVTLDARLGGRFVERWHDGLREAVTAGTVLEFSPPRRIALSWADDDWTVETQVAIGLSAASTVTRLTLRHAGWAGFAEPQRARLVAAHRNGWRLHLAALKAFAEDG